jgi:bacterioferritin
LKGNDKLLALLNLLLSQERTAIAQYVIHAEMCDHWG